MTGPGACRHAVPADRCPTCLGIAPDPFDMSDDAFEAAELESWLDKRAPGGLHEPA